MEILIPAGVMGAVGLLLSGLLLFAAKKFYVYEDPLIGEVDEMLPGANCGGCGKAGCKAFAEGLVAGEEGNCPVANSETMQAIAQLLGKELSGADPLVAHVMCEGLRSSATFSGMYSGIEDCRAAHLIGQVDRACSYGCVGMGSCVDACAFDAIDICNGIARIIPENCVACAKCVVACPRELIVMIPKGRQVFVPCKSHDSGKVTTKVCEIGCIGCMKCVKVCAYDAIPFSDNLAEIDPEKCTLCYECIDACPRHLIKVRDLNAFMLSEADLRHGLDDSAATIWKERMRKKEEEAEARKAELAASTGEDPETAAKRAKFEKALADARAKADADPEYAKKLPVIEKKILANIEKLGPPTATETIDPELLEKRKKIEKALATAKAKAEVDPEYALKFPKIEAGFKAKLLALDPASKAAEHDVATLDKSQAGEEQQ